MNARPGPGLIRAPDRRRETPPSLRREEPRRPRPASLPPEEPEHPEASANEVAHALRGRRSEILAAVKEVTDPTRPDSASRFPERGNQRVEVALEEGDEPDYELDFFERWGRWPLTRRAR